MLNFWSGFYLGVVIALALEVLAVGLLVGFLYRYFGPSILPPADDSSKVLEEKAESITESQQDKSATDSQLLKKQDLTLDDIGIAECFNKNILRLPKLFPPNMPVETASWLNVVLNQLLLQMKSQGLNEKLQDILNKEFSVMQQKSKVINYIYASRFEVGVSPPEVKTFQILPTDPARKDLEILAQLIYLGGFTMELHTQMNLYSVIEAHLKVVIKDCFGNLLLRFSEGDTPDSFTVTITLADNPTFHLDIESSVGNFTDLSVIDQVITNTLKMIIARRFVDPNGKRYKWSPKNGFLNYPIEIEEKQKSVERKKKRRVYGPVAGRLYVHIVEAIDLPKRVKDNTADTYSMVSFNRQSKKTKIIPKSVNPKWDETFVFDVFDLHDGVVLSVYDRERLTKDEFLGHVRCPLNNLPPNVEVPFAMTLSSKDKSSVEFGTLCFALMFEPFDHENMVVYMKEKDLNQFENNLVRILDEKAAEEHRKKLAELYENKEMEMEVTPVSASSQNNDRAKTIKNFLNRSANTDSAAGSPSLTSAEILPSAEKREPVYYVVVTVVQARSLMPADKTGSSDPYAMVTVSRTNKKTKIEKASLSPIWKEKFYFPVVSPPKEVTVQVFDWNRFSQHTFLGQAVATLGAFDLETLKGGNLGIPQKLPLKPRIKEKGNGDITGEIEVIIELEYISEASIQEATKERSGSIDSMGEIESVTTVEKKVSIDATITEQISSFASSRPPSFGSFDNTTIASSMMTRETVTHAPGSPSKKTVAVVSAQAKEQAKALASNLSNKFQTYFAKKESMTKTSPGTETLFPPVLAEKSWDNVGLLVEAAVEHSGKNLSVLLTIDLTPKVAEEALKDSSISLIIAYHPVIFQPLKRLTLDDPKTASILKLLSRGISVYSPHTAVDSTPGGMNDWLCSVCGAIPVSPVTSADPVIINSLPDHLKPKANMCGSGRIGAFKEKSTIKNVLDRLKKELNRDHIRYALGNDHQLNSEVQSVAVCVGSGSSLLKRAKGADLLVTGEMSHHEILACVAMNKSVVLLEHSASERGFLPTMKQSLVDLIQKDTSIAVKPDIIISQADKEPVEFY